VQTAERIDGLSRSLREEDVGALLTRAEQFARRQPTAFLGTSVALGFAMARFLKSSSERGRATSNPTTTPDPAATSRRPTFGPTT